MSVIFSPRPWLDARKVKRRADFLAIASRYMRLRRKGQQHVGRCPFHLERHPSCYIEPEGKIWKCFGCQQGGDLFDFVMLAEDCTFSDALWIVADSSSGVARESGPRSGPRFRASVGAASGPAKQGPPNSQLTQERPNHCRPGSNESAASRNRGHKSQIPLQGLPASKSVS